LTKQKEDHNRIEDVKIQAQQMIGGIEPVEEIIAECVDHDHDRAIIREYLRVRIYDITVIKIWMKEKLTEIF
jgi:hypothetical protein